MLKIYYWTICMAFGTTLASGGDMSAFIEMFININFLFFFLILARGVGRFLYFKYLIDKDVYNKLTCQQEFEEDLQTWTNK